MYVSTSQLALSLERLKDLHPFFGFAFFGFKKAGIPVGETARCSYRVIRENVLEPYFRPLRNYPGFFNPFKSTRRWVNDRYDTTSLQRVVADTFGAAFLHETGSSEWGWRENYIEVLSKLMRKHQSSPISLLDLAVWFYREDSDIPNEVSASSYLMSRLIDEFQIDNEELLKLFSPPRERAVSLSPEAPDMNELWNIVGWPEGFQDLGGVALDYLHLQNVGPARDLEYVAASRLNVLTGDNSLGKTFLLDCAWWAVTGNWQRHEVEPRRASRRSYSQIAYGIRSPSGRVVNVESPFDRLEDAWQRPIEQSEGIGIYATHSGSFALWDPVRPPNEPRALSEWATHLTLSREEVWDGVWWRDRSDRAIQVCNGLIRDWAIWRSLKEKHDEKLITFERCLKELSPPEGPQLRAGALLPVAGDSREFPSIRMPYGDVPVIYASAGVQRILALAYVVVWHWNQHIERCKKTGRTPFRQLTVLIDEVEAHLHPKWQRQILPALVRAISAVASEADVQIHVATHSPLVLASLEPSFDSDIDAIHHLSMEEDDVTLEMVEAYKQGTVNSWLESDIFGLSAARSFEAETAINEAKELQLKKRPAKSRIREVHGRLLRYLPDDDTFWVRWIHFAEQNGIVERPRSDTRQSRS
jgi:hypothetical protein